jgi:hypothetical protein
MQAKHTAKSRHYAGDALQKTLPQNPQQTGITADYSMFENNKNISNDNGFQGT